MESGQRTVSAGEAGTSLRQALRAWTGASLRRVNALVDAGAVLVDGRREGFGSARLRAGSRVEWRAAGPGTPAGDRDFHVEPERVLFRDGRMLVYDKAPGYPCQRTMDPGRWNLEDALARWWTEHGGAGGLLLAHRLDRDTSGVLLLAAGRELAAEMMDWFRDRLVRKHYVALCHGEAAPGSAGLWRHRLDRVGEVGGRERRGIVRSGGQSAVTAWRVLGSGGGLSFWLLRPHTGRTHQLRVQLAAAGHPVAGDALYDPDFRRREEAPHQMLHAARLELPASWDGLRVFRAPLPGRLAARLERARIPAELPEGLFDAELPGPPPG